MRQFISTVSTITVLIITISIVNTLGDTTKLPAQNEFSHDENLEKDEESFDNPFTSEEGIATENSSEADTKPGIKPTEKKEKAPPFWYKFNFGKKYVTTLQKNLNEKISGLVNDFKNNMTFMKAFLIFFFSFIYAILHSAGPGHGKLILGTYFLTNDQKSKKSDAAVAGLIVSLTHNGMAVLLSGVLYLLIHSFGDQRYMQDVAKRVGGIFVIITGIVIMLTTLYRNKLSFLNNEKNTKKLKKYPLYIIAMLSGIVPCPLAWTILVMCITLGLYGLGLLSVFGMALGAGITVGATGLIILTGKEKLFGYIKKERAEKFAYILRFFGGIFLVLFGYLMLQIVY